MKKVFLGGTCNGSLWRDDVIKKLKIHYYNPVGEEWTPEMMEEELKQRKECDFCLYVLTPKMEGFFAIAEVIDDSNKRPNKTIFSFFNEDEGKTFSEVQIKSLKQVAKMVKENGAKYFDKMKDAIDFLNHQ
jgi:Nucleoside 2-deoxyribosyltransferase like